MDVQPIGFKVNRDRIGQELTNFAWDSLDWDMEALSTNPEIGYDPDATQNWYELKFVGGVQSLATWYKLYSKYFCKK